MVEITYQMVLNTIQTASLVIGIIYYITIMRNQQRNQELSLKAQQEAEKARQNELVFQKFQNINPEFSRTFYEVMLMNDWEDAEEWEEKYGLQNNLEAYSKWNYLTRYYEIAGIMLKHGADPDIIFELYPEGAVINLWELFEPIVEHMRIMFKNPTRQDILEYLYSEAKKRRPDLGQ